MKKPQILKETIIYQSDLSQVISAQVKLSNEKIVTWDYFGNADVVAILPIDKEGNIYFSKEWRPAWKKEVIQIPAGHCLAKTEKGRVLQAHNELREEIGMDTKNLTKLVSYAASARMNYLLHLYIAKDIYPSYKAPDDDEFIEVVKIPFKKAFQRFVVKGELTTSSTITALVMAKDLI